MPHDCRWVMEESKIIIEEDEQITNPGLVRLQNGDLLLTASETHHVHDQTYVYRSADGGHTWSKRAEIQHKPRALDFDAVARYTQGLCILESGRLVMTYSELGQTQSDLADHKWQFDRLESVQYGLYSNDEGKTWHYTNEMDVSPFLSFCPYACGAIFEDDDGTLVSSFRGHLNRTELDQGTTSTGLVRSHDGGLTWGDANALHLAVPDSYEWFNENAVIPVADDRWLNMSRCNYTDASPSSVRDICILHSNDKGRTWSEPIKTGIFGGEGFLLTLPDADLLYVWAHTNPEVHLDEGEPIGIYHATSDDDGQTWSERQILYRRPPERPREHLGTAVAAIMDDETVLVVYHCGRIEHGEGKMILAASWLKRVG